jgi:hypothetical protein
MAQVSHLSFATTGTRGIRHDILPMRLYHKAKKLGVWDPRAIDFTQDKLDWQNCTTNQKETLLSLTALFQAGEESVTLDLLPLIMVQEYNAIEITEISDCEREGQIIKSNASLLLTDNDVIATQMRTAKMIKQCYTLLDQCF